MTILVKNEIGREMLINKEDYQRLIQGGLKLRIIENKPERHKKIGVFLQRNKTGETYCASDRIRGEWVIKSNDEMELYQEGVDYEAVIFHRACEEISDFGGIKILDICDNVWKNDEFFKFIETVDAIVVPTEGMKDELSKRTDKDIYVIGDGHYFPHYESRDENKHIRKAKDVIWFGYAKNFEPVIPLIGEIEKNGLNLKVIAQEEVGYGEFIKWDIETYIKEISKCDFAILPKNGNLKSDNKTITALLCGIPVAKDAKDIKRLLNPKERVKDLSKFDKETYSSKFKATEYLKLIDKIKSERPAVYTAIKGNYEKPRKDIKVFADRVDDKFKQPVMNAKIYKILPHKFFKTEYSIWMDGNIFPIVSTDKILELLGDADIALFKQPYRDCIYKEAVFARERVSDEYKDLIDEQMSDYRKEGMPENFGLWECGMIIRKHSPIVEEFNNRWWSEICRYSQRDQLSFPYVVWKMPELKVKVIDGNVRSHKFYRYVNR